MQVLNKSSLLKNTFEKLQFQLKINQNRPYRSFENPNPNLVLANNRNYD